MQHTLHPSSSKSLGFPGIFSGMSYRNTHLQSTHNSGRNLRSNGRMKRKASDTTPLPQRETSRLRASSPLVDASTLSVTVLPVRRRFVGRQDLLDQLAAQLDEARELSVCCSAGEAGSGTGSTSAVLEYAWTRAASADVEAADVMSPPAARQYRHVFWLRAHTQTALEDGVADAAARVLGQEVTRLDTPGLAVRWQSWLAGQPDASVLLVLQHPPQQRSLLAPFLPPQSCQHVLVLGHGGDWASTLRVPPLSSAGALEAAGLEPEAEAMSRLAGVLHDNPLALQLTARTIAALDWTPDKAVAALRDPATPLEAVTRAVAMATTNLPRPAQALLRLCSMLAPDDVPLSLLRSLDPAAFGDVAQALAVLEARCLVTRDAHGVSMHRLVHRVVRQFGRPEERAAAVSAAVQVVAAAWTATFRVADPVTWPQARSLIQHVDHVRAHCLAAQQELPRLHQLLPSVITYTEVVARRSRTALALRSDAASLACNVAGVNSSEYARALTSLAMAHHAAGNAQQALTIAQRAAGIAVVQDGPDSETYATTLNVLGLTHLDLEQRDEAERVLQQALAIDHALFGDAHDNTLRDLDALAEAYRELGRWKDAVPLYQRVLARLQPADESEVSARWLHELCSLASCYADMDMEHEAITAYQQALPGARQVYGPDSPLLADLLHRLGVSLLHVDKHDEAEAALAEALHLRTQMAGSDDPDTRASREWLADCRGSRAAAAPPAK